MDYETAKTLRDAGFPQKGDGVYVGNVGNLKPEDFSPGGVVGIAEDDFFYIPTLSELIEACDKPIMLHVREDGTCQAFNGLNTFCDKDGSGSTPIIAVASLYIALNS